MKFIYKVLLASSFMLASTHVSANESTGYIDSLFVNQQGIVLFRLTNPVNQRPKCANNADWDYKFELQKTPGKALFKMLNIALEKNLPLKVGYGAQPNCGKGFPAVEIEYIYFKQLHRNKTSKKGNYAR